MSDNTTIKRYEHNFSKDHLVKAYHKNCDESLRCTPELVEKIENDVTTWLNDQGVESSLLELSLKPEGHILFRRAELALKTAANNWTIYHIAQSGKWPRLISSKPKLTVQHPPELVTLKNEIRCLTYGEVERKQSIFAQVLSGERMKKNANKEPCLEEQNNEGHKA